MHKRKLLHALAILLGLLAPLLAGPAVMAQQEGAIHLTFHKSAVSEGIWEGSVGGDVEGDLRTVLLAADTSAPVWQVEFDWIIGAGEKSFTARLRGTLDSETGAVAMAGTVIEGWMQGATVHEVGQLVDAGTSTFAGTIQVVAPAPQMLPTTGGEGAGGPSWLTLLIAALLAAAGLTG